MIKETSGYKKGNMRLRQPVLKYPATEWRVPHSVQHSEGQKKNIKYRKTLSTTLEISED